MAKEPQVLKANPYKSKLQEAKPRVNPNGQTVRKKNLSVTKRVNAKR